MPRTTSWIWKSSLLSAAFGLAAFVGCYLFLRAHQELEIQPSRCWQIGVLAFVVSAIVSLTYLRMRPGR
jgi:hypothetical protein